MSRVMYAVTVVAVVFLGFVWGASTMHLRGAGADYFEEMFSILEASGLVEARRKLPAPQPPVLRAPL